MRKAAAEDNTNIDGIEIDDPRSDARLASLRRGCAGRARSMTPAMAARLVAKPLYFGGMMVRQGDADGDGGRLPPIRPGA